MGRSHGTEPPSVKKPAFYPGKKPETLTRLDSTRCLGDKSGMRMALSTLLFLAVFIQAFIPAGFMPGTGVATMVICSGMEQKTITVDENGQPAEEQKQTGCAFAPVLAFSIPAGPILTFSPFEFTPVLINPVASDRSVSFYHSAQPQGPPLFV